MPTSTNFTVAPVLLIADTVGIAVLTTSVTIAFGFSVLCLSNFVPTVFFGVFTALAMIFAMIGVLLVLPSIIYKIKWFCKILFFLLIIL